MFVVKWSKFVAILVVFILSFSVSKVFADENLDSLFSYVGDSLMKAKKGDMKAVSENIHLFETSWVQIKKDSKLADKVDEHLADVKKEVESKADSEDIRSHLSALSTALINYDHEQNPVDTSRDKEKLKQLLPLIEDMKDGLNTESYPLVKSQYDRIFKQWNEAELAVSNESTSSYGQIETYMAFVRIAITQDPIDQKKAVENLNGLQTAIENFLSGKAAKGSKEDYSLSDVAKLLERSSNALSGKKVDAAIEDLNEILFIWPMVEGDVSTRDSKLYSDMETKVPTAISLLQSKNAKVDEAQAILTDLHTRLQPLLGETKYSTWDAALILLREGLEALLVVATLLSFLKRVGQASKQKWIWLGVFAGFVLSAVLAFMINIIFSQFTAASSREYIEGITGIVAVFMMLTVGVWLHSKSNIQSWNRYIGKQMDQAIATGSLFSFALISFLSIFREGAETIIFYAGMAPNMRVTQLMTGIGIAAVILVVVGFVMLRYSTKIPITPFLKGATLLIYMLAFKILGVSIHSLQVSQVLTTHAIPSFPFIEWIGLYPSWETLLSQVGLLLVIVLTTMVIKKKTT